MTEVEPVGLFERIRETEDHIYGERLHLWRKGDEPLGELLLYEGGPEPLHRGFIARGYIGREVASMPS